MTNQPEALRLADILEHKIPSIKCLEVSATELRRLYEVNTELVEALKYAIKYVPQLATVPGIKAIFARADGTFIDEGTKL